jgi:hypothetical protein
MVKGILVAPFLIIVKRSSFLALLETCGHRVCIIFESHCTMQIGPSQALVFLEGERRVGVKHNAIVLEK